MANETPPWGTVSQTISDPMTKLPLPGGNPMDVTHQPPEQAQVDNPFHPTVPDNPFLTPPAPDQPEPPQPHAPPKGTPAWNTFVGFILEYGNKLVSAEYPTPRGEVVDTMWAGIPVKDGARARVRHKTAGWVNWETAILGTHFEHKD